MNPYPNLKVLRLQNNFKQEYVADALGMSQPEYSKLESGQRKLDGYNIRNLCNLYDISSDILLSKKPSSSESGNARSSTPTEKTSTKNSPISHELISNEVIMKLMENYSFLLDSYLRQQQTQQKILDKLIGQMDEKKRTENN